VERAWTASFDLLLIAKLDADVGYYCNEDGLLQYDLTFLLPVSARRGRACHSGVCLGLHHEVPGCRRRSRGRRVHNPPARGRRSRPLSARRQVRQLQPTVPLPQRGIRRNGETSAAYQAVLRRRMS
jgi:hypothetical protein